jgi:subtilisin family serine protease
MSERRRRGSASLWISLSTVLVCLLNAASLGAQSWSTPLLSRDLVIVEKTKPGSGQPAGPLPPALVEKLGPDFVDYESFVAVRLAPGPARSLMEAARTEGYGVLRESRRTVHLPFRDLDLGRPDATPPGWEGSPLQPAPVPGMFVVRFSFPLQPDWTEALAGCVEGKPLYLGDGAFLVRAAGLSSIRTCGIARYLDWAGPYLGTDRMDRQELDRSGDGFLPFTLTFLPGIEEQTALGELPAAVRVLGLNRWDSDDTLSLAVLAGRPELEALLKTSGRLFAVSPSGEAHLSDERQGLIAAGRHNGTQITPYPGQPGYVPYLTWLSNRGLRTASNQQTVAVFDTGYDDGTGPAGAHHPDLENPERLVDNANYVASPPTAVTTDAQGHGTMVAGVIAGNGTGSGVKDAQGFYLGMGIAPDAKLVSVQVFARMGTDCTISNILDKILNPGLLKLKDAITFSRTNASGGDKALIANHSWNTGVMGYDEHAKLMDERTVDGDPGRAGLQPMLMVVAAGNRGDLQDTVENPGTAKNVITVGATQNYRPSSETSAPPNTCDPPAPAKYTTEADQVGQVSQFSARGKHFAALPDFQLVHNIPVKPDLVAAGGKIFSPVPYQATSTYVCQGICRDYWPDVLPPTDYHSYGQGTSFAAPVVAGIAALLRKQFLDVSINPSPSLIKANLIGTADDLNVAGDHRPSNVFGWGRANLDRATDTSIPRYSVNEAPALAVTTGQERTWTRTIDNPGRDTYIVLAWSDVASALFAVTLINDLRLTVESLGGNKFWRGNNFNENVMGVDNGYSYTYTAGGDPGLYDTVNTVEAIFIPKNTFAANQQIVIRVTGSSVQSGAQSFSFYAYNVR